MKEFGGPARPEIVDTAFGFRVRGRIIGNDIDRPRRSDHDVGDSPSLCLDPPHIDIPHPKGSGPLNAVAGHGDVYRLKKGVIRFDVESVLQGL